MTWNITWRDPIHAEGKLLIYCPSSAYKFSGTESPDVFVLRDQCNRAAHKDTDPKHTLNLTVCIKTLSLYFNSVKETIHTLLIENRGGVCSTTTISSDYFLNPKMEFALPTWSFFLFFPVYIYRSVGSALFPLVVTLNWYSLYMYETFTQHEYHICQSPPAELLYRNNQMNYEGI